MKRRLVTVEDMSVVFEMAKNFDKTADKLDETIQSIVQSLSTVQKATEETKNRMGKTDLSLNMDKLAKLDLSQPICEVKKLCASLLELNTDMDSVGSSRDNLAESDWTFYRKWLVKNEFAAANDNEGQVATMRENYEFVKDMTDALAFALHNRNDDILRDGRYTSDHQEQSRYIREHDGMLTENIDDAKYNELLAEFKRWQERRNLLGAIIGVEDERTGVQTQINKSRKYLDKVAGVEDDKKKKPIYTIEAETEPAYIVKGSMADKRQSYSNAQAKANRIQTDYEIGLIGKDEARKQIADLNKELEGLGAGLKPIEIDVDAKGFTRQMDKIKKAWSGVEGIGNGVESITSALSGEKNAWEAVSGVVSGFIQVSEGVESVVEIVNLLVKASAAHTAVKTAEAAATGTSTTASAADAVGKAAEATAVLPVVAANKLATASFLELASASYFAAHASIPFVGFGIAAGFAASAAAVTEAMGALMFATGGIVPGNQTTGDKVAVRVNSGEMILNARQQARLFAIANGAAVYGSAIGVGTEWSTGMRTPDVHTDLERLRGLSVAAAPQTQETEWRIRGRDLVRVIANETRLSGKRSGIKI